MTRVCVIALTAPVIASDKDLARPAAAQGSRRSGGRAAPAGGADSSAASHALGPDPGDPAGGASPGAMK